MTFISLFSALFEVNSALASIISEVGIYQILAASFSSSVASHVYDGPKDGASRLSGLLAGLVT